MGLNGEKGVKSERGEEERSGKEREVHFGPSPGIIIFELRQNLTAPIQYCLERRGGVINTCNMVSTQKYCYPENESGNHSYGSVINLKQGFLLSWGPAFQF